MAGALLIVSAILAVGDPARPELGQIVGGLPMIVKDVLGPGLGRLFLIDVVFAVFVCALAVHAGTVRLIFAMARDNNLPMARALGHVPRRTPGPGPAGAPGRRAGRGAPGRQHQPPARDRDPVRVAIVWVNLAYLLVTLPMLVARLRRRWRPDRLDPSGGGRLFSMGRLGLPINAIAVAWGILVVINIAWPRAEIYGPDPWGRFAAPLSTLVLLVRRRPLLRDRPAPADRGHDRGAPAGTPRRRAGLPGRTGRIEGHWIGRLAANE